MSVYSGIFFAYLSFILLFSKEFKGMRKILIILTVILAIFGCANKNNNDIFKDPSTQKNTSKQAFLYKINKKDTDMPIFIRLPQDKKNISLSFEKIGSASVPVILNNDINGWNAFSSKALSQNNEDFGIIIDFAGGGVYEMPKDDVKTYLNNFNMQDAFIIKELVAGKNNTGFTKMVAVDAAALYNKEEINHLVLLNDLDLANQIQNVFSDKNQNRNIPKVESDKTFNKTNKNAVILDKPLITAATNGQYDLLLKLLDNNANINELDPETLNNALITAIGNGDENVANLLLDKGINSKHKNKNNQSALHIASNYGLYNIADRLLKEGLPVNDKDNGGNTPLMYAAASPNTFVTDLLIDNGARMEDKNIDGETPLLIAARTGNTKTVENLIKKGADISATDNEGNGVVMKATTENNKYTLQNLLSRGLNPDLRNKKGYTPLMAAVQKSNIDISNDLLKAGANINAKDPMGNTPLMTATMSGDTPMVRELLKHKPDIQIKNKEDKNAYDLAQDNGYAQLQRILGQNMKTFDDASLALFEKTAKNDIDGAINAIKNGANPNAKDKNTGNTPLFTAVANNYHYLTQSLIANGADVNIRNNLGNIPLIVAVTSADTAMVDILLKAKSEVNAANKNGDTALIWATKLKNTDMVRLLLLMGADPNKKNNDGVSPYLIAYNEESNDILGLLQAAGGYK